MTSFPSLIHPLLDAEQVAAGKTFRESWLQRKDVERDFVTVRVKAARNVPLTDLFHGADVFCAVLVEDVDGLFQTEVRRGTSERDWIWDPDLSRCLLALTGV